MPGYVDKALACYWDSTIMHIKAFGLRLDKVQKRLELLGIAISDKDKLQFYMEQSTHQTFLIGRSA
jgi:hypothetical protein